MVLLSISLSLQSFQTLWWQSLKTNVLAASWKKKCPMIRDEKNASLVELKIYKFGENLGYMYM